MFSILRQTFTAVPRNVTRVDPSLPGVMDYCLPCRRHLNGALVCPGCGTPADRIPGPAAVEPEPGEPEKGPGEGRPGGEPEPVGGRAERRGRKAAAHRRRRRRTVLLAAGLVLAAGGLGFAELGTDAPLPFTGGGTATVKDTSADDGDSSSPSGRTTAPPQVTNVSATSGATASASGSPAAGASDSASPSAAGTTEPPPSAPTAPGSPVTAPTAPPPPRPTAAPPTTAPATSAPPPAPSPTRTCDRFLWWCT
ncbi:SCO2400 family protein [Streptomyces murinus]|uniref:SCO2400 family protein n=1 Tax=Streptomyces murinus TaxID=33900 RepID=UPI003F4463A6